LTGRVASGARLRCPDPETGRQEHGPKPSLGEAWKTSHSCRFEKKRVLFLDVYAESAAGIWHAACYMWLQWRRDRRHLPAVHGTACRCHPLLGNGPPRHLAENKRHSMPISPTHSAPVCTPVVGSSQTFRMVSRILAPIFSWRPPQARNAAPPRPFEFCHTMTAPVKELCA